MLVHHKIEDNQCRFVVLKGYFNVLNIQRMMNNKPFATQNDFQRFTVIFIIINNQYLFFLRHYDLRYGN